MFGLFLTSMLLLAEASHASPGKFTQFYNDYLNYPGFEVWKFVNLAIFVSIMTYLVRKPLGDAFRDRRDQIRAELIKAEQDKKAAMADLTVVEGKLAQLESEKETLLQRARDEAALEKSRLADATKAEVDRLRQQNDAELARVVGQSRSDLRRFSADEAIRLAEERLRSRIDPAVDLGLIKASIQEIGGLN